MAQAGGGANDARIPEEGKCDFESYISPESNGNCPFISSLEHLTPFITARKYHDTPPSPTEHRKNVSSAAALATAIAVSSSNPTPFIP
jgi:hypothetical protein